MTAIGFSGKGTYLAASDAAEKITVHVFKLSDPGTKAIATVSINMKIVHLAWSPNVEELFATAGKDHVAMCTLSGNTITVKKGKAGKGGSIESQCSAAWVNNPAHKNALLTGGSDGKIYHWTGD